MVARQASDDRGRAQGECAALALARWWDRGCRLRRRLLHLGDFHRRWFRELSGFYRHLAPWEFWFRYHTARLEAAALHVSHPDDFWTRTDYYVLRQMFYHRDACWHAVAATIPHDGWLLEWGAGVAPITAWMRRHRPDVHCIVADIPCRTRDFATWRFRGDQRVTVTGVEDAWGRTKPWGTVDAAVAYEVLEHVPSPLMTLHTLLRSLSPGGALHLDYEAGPAGGGNSDAGLREREAVLDVLEDLRCVVPLRRGRGIWRV